MRISIHTSIPLRGFITAYVCPKECVLKPSAQVEADTGVAPTLNGPAHDAHRRAHLRFLGAELCGRRSIGHDVRRADPRGLHRRRAGVVPTAILHSTPALAPMLVTLILIVTLGAMMSTGVAVSMAQLSQQDVKTVTSDIALTKVSMVLLVAIQVMYIPTAEQGWGSHLATPVVATTLIILLKLMKIRTLSRMRRDLGGELLCEPTPERNGRSASALRDGLVVVAFTLAALSLIAGVAGGMIRRAGASRARSPAPRMPLAMRPLRACEASATAAVPPTMRFLCLLLPSLGGGF